MTTFSAQACVAAAAALFSVSVMAQGSTSVTAPDAAESAMVKAVDASTAGDIAMLEQIVDINSGTMNFAGVVRVKDTIEPQLQALGFKTVFHPMDQLSNRAGDLVAEHPCPAGKGKCGKHLLLIGHMDTVFELASPFQRYSVVPGTNGRIATGPGVADMKGGLVILLSALRAMKAAGALDATEITVVLDGDEEKPGAPIGVARKDLIDAGKRSDLALEFENASRLGGIDGQDAVRLGRRSSGTWVIEATGRTGHSSGIFGDAMGYGAIYELTRILDAFRKELPEPGLTYNVGVILGGTSAAENAEKTGGTATGKTNVIPPAAIARGDLRTLDEEQNTRVKKKMEAIVRDHLARTGATIEFFDTYPAMGVTEGSQALLAKLQAVNATLGFGPSAVVDPKDGGAGDIAFVAPYVPGLVGTGSMGAGAHAEGETVYLDSLTKQAKRMAVLMYRLSGQGK